MGIKWNWSEKSKEGIKGDNNPMYGRKHTKNTKQLISDAHKGKTNKGYKWNNNSKEKIKGKGNPNWVGDKVCFGALHRWVIRNKPKSMFCEICGKITGKLDCANISGKYLRDISDFRWLCRRCHMKEDGRLTTFYKKSPRYIIHNTKEMFG